MTPELQLGLDSSGVAGPSDPRYLGIQCPLTSSSSSPSSSHLSPAFLSCPGLLMVESPGAASREEPRVLVRAGCTHITPSLDPTVAMVVISNRNRIHFN